jgi:hypothetical protein
MRKELIRTGFYVLGIFAVGFFVVGLFFAPMAYMQGEENRRLEYWVYLRTISSYSFLHAQKPNTPCLDAAYFVRELVCVP